MDGALEVDRKNNNKIENGRGSNLNTMALQIDDDNITLIPMATQDSTVLEPLHLDKFIFLNK